MLASAASISDSLTLRDAASVQCDLSAQSLRGHIGIIEHLDLAAHWTAAHTAQCRPA